MIYFHFQVAAKFVHNDHSYRIASNLHHFQSVHLIFGIPYKDEIVFCHNYYSKARKTLESGIIITIRKKR